MTDIGIRYFSVAAPTLWNSLRDNGKSANTVMTFCHQLKSYLSNLAYPLSALVIQWVMTTWNLKQICICPIILFLYPTELMFLDAFGAIEVYVLLLL